MFKSCQEYIEKRINNRNLGYEIEKCELRDAVLETLEQRQSSFILLVGQCGSGKKKVRLYNVSLYEVHCKYTNFFIC